MVELKLVINNKDGKSYAKILPDSSTLVGKKIGDSVNGDLIGLTGYELQISGGSDNSGSPMKKGLNLSGKKKIFAKAGLGINPKNKGNYMRKTLAGNTVHEKTAQLNLIITQAGKKALNDLLGKKEETKEGEEPVKEAKEEKPAEVKAEKKVEEKPKAETKDQKGEQTENKDN
jgi:small subunit ribosomal protein S6e|tara:strand:- start:595 stop:1113 length:519 start_codon:yes stop_codon:yes gene_type:complete